MSAAGVDRAARAFAAVLRGDERGVKDIILEDPNATELLFGLLGLGAAAIEELARELGVSWEQLVDMLLLRLTKISMEEGS